jgi:hypothetical protein
LKSSTNGSFEHIKYFYMMWVYYVLACELFQRHATSHIMGKQR